MGRRALLLAAVGLALVIWLPLGLAGVPLDTPDGFLHLGWAVGWVKQLEQGWLWPTWSDLPWAGAGSSALLIYPPLFRQLVGWPMLLGIPPDHALATGLLLVCLLNNLGVAALANQWIARRGWCWLLLICASLNPYWLVNLYVRGAWPEALAQALLWWLALGFWGLEKQRRWGWYLTGGALAGIVLSNWNAALLTGIAWFGAGTFLIGRRAWKGWCWSCALGLGLSLPFWGPALVALPTVRPPIPAGLVPGEFFGGEDTGYRTFAGLLWIQALAIVLLLIWQQIGWRGTGRSQLSRWGCVLAVGSLVMTLDVSQPLYDWLTPLQRIQFPWRWLGLGWFGVLIALGSGAEKASRNWSGRRAALWLLGLAVTGCWFDGLWRFRSNLFGHAPSRSETLALRKLLRCDPLLSCPAGVKVLPKEGELSKRFAALPDGRIALAGVSDYTPVGVPEKSWYKRQQVFWLPAWPQDGWAELDVQGSAEMVSKSATERILRVEAEMAGRLRVMQWADPKWMVEMGNSQGWSKQLTASEADEDGWIRIDVPAGESFVRMSYQESFLRF